MHAWPWLAPGILLPLLLPAVPGWLPVTVVLACCCLLPLLSKSPPMLFLMAGSCWALLSLDARLDRRLEPEPDVRVAVSGWVASLPVRRGDLLEFRFVAESVAPGAEGRMDGLPGILPAELLVRWYRDAPAVRAGSRWRLLLRLKPARSVVNFHGPDRERWYFSEGIAAIGIVEGSGPLADDGAHFLLRMRQALHGNVTRTLDGHPSLPLALALSLADRSEVRPGDWARFRETGTGHLLAISGMHVGLAAMTGFWLGRLLAVFMPHGWSLRLGTRLPWFASAGFAVIYALLAGMGTSTRRALAMLGVLVLMGLARRSASPWSGLLAALVLVLLLDPLAAAGAGFWFSFTAVTVLLALFATRTGVRGRTVSLLMAQCGIGLVMAPLGMVWFQQFTLLGFVGNLFAIPWVSLAVVPPLLVAIILAPLGGWLPSFLMIMAAESLNWLTRALEWLANAGNSLVFETFSPPPFTALAAMAGGLLLLGPRGSRLQLLGLLLLSPLALPDRRANETLRVEMLDVGQGLSVLVETEDHLLVYDSGPGDGQTWSLVAPVVAPAVRQSRAGDPDRVVISHGDLDHAGGLHELGFRFPATAVYANLGRELPGTLPCLGPMQWSWDGVTFRVLHPGKGLPYLGNDNSCVISARIGSQGVLLTGDIGHAVERRLVDAGLARHDILFAPHHGSKSSSHGSLIDAVQPRYGLVSSGYRNRFGFPASEVSRRYAERGVTVLNTSDCGAIEIVLSRGRPPELRSARRVRTGPWRWPAAEICP